jgi:hypothetical protein
VKTGCIYSILLLKSNLSSWPCLSICEQNETRKPNHAAKIIFVDYKSFFTLEVWNPDLCRWEAAANPSVLSVLWVDFLSVCPAWSDIMSGCKGVLNMVRKVLYTYIYIYIYIYAFSFSLRYIDLDKKHYFNIQPFIYRDIFIVWQFAEYYLGIRVISCNSVTVAV